MIKSFLQMGLSVDGIFPSGSREPSGKNYGTFRWSSDVSPTAARYVLNPSHYLKLPKVGG